MNYDKEKAAFFGMDWSHIETEHDKLLPLVLERTEARVEGMRESVAGVEERSA